MVVTYREDGGNGRGTEDEEDDIHLLDTSPD